VISPTARGKTAKSTTANADIGPGKDSRSHSKRAGWFSMSDVAGLLRDAKRQRDAHQPPFHSEVPA